MSTPALNPHTPAPTFAPCPGWLPAGKRAALCFSIDDVHPATSADEYESGGDLGRGALGRLERLLERQPQLRVTLFVTPDWRLQQLTPTRAWLSRIPGVRECVHWAPRRRPGHFRIDRFPAFVAYLNGLRATDIAVHGLTHSHRGAHMAAEFQQQSRDECNALLRAALEIFAAAGLRPVPGFQAPAWSAPPALCAALPDSGFQFLGAARDLRTPVRRGALTAMSGLQGVSLFEPMWILPPASDRVGDPRSAERALVHIPTNFQATSTIERAFDIVETGGLISIKAHIFKSGGGITMLDGLDDAYINYLDLLCSELHRRYGESLWWTSLAEVADRCRTGFR